ncbi:MAG: hypothetical protein ACFE9A_20940 [Candidatus Hodarchaeota archaeon]
MPPLGERIIERLGGVTQAEAKQMARRAAEMAYEDMGEDEPITGTVKKQGYKTLTGTAVRDLGGIDYGQVLNAAWKIFLSNPVAKRYLQVKRDYILGRGVEPTTPDKDLQVILNEFWKGNKLRHRLKKFTLQLFLLGEQMYPAFVRESDGRVRIGYIDPAEIKRVITHPENVLEQWAVVVKARLESTDEWIESQEERVYRIIREDEGVVDDNGDVKPPKNPSKLVTAEQAELEEWERRMLNAYGLSEYSGSCFYTSVNNLSNQPRGYSDLLQVSDWLDQLDSILFALTDREQMADYFSFDVTLEGADPDDVAERARKFRRNPPKKGSVNVHNEKETWNLNRPDLKQSGSIESGKTILTFILGGVAMPRHWYGFGDETNRATAEAQGAPTWRTMETDQDQARDMVMQMLTFARDQAEIAGAWKAKGEGDGEIKLPMPEMASRDVGAVAQALNLVATALTMVEMLGLMTHETMAEVWAKVVNELGVEMNATEELAALAKGAEEEEMASAEQVNQNLLMRLGEWVEYADARATEVRQQT